MVVLRNIGYLAFAAAALLFLYVLGGGEFGYIVYSIGLVISGVVFIAFDKVITTLCEIRDLLSNKDVDEVIEHGVIVKESTKTNAEPETDMLHVRKWT